MNNGEDNDHSPWNAVKQLPHPDGVGVINYEFTTN